MLSVGQSAAKKHCSGHLKATEKIVIREYLEKRFCEVNVNGNNTVTFTLPAAVVASL